MFNISFKSHIIRHSCTRRAFKDTQRELEYLRHSEGTQSALGGRLGTWALKALGHSDIQGTQALGHLGTWGTWGTQALGHLGT